VLIVDQGDEPAGFAGSEAELEKAKERYVELLESLRPINAVVTGTGC
jgi:hypothetical protein